jgi:Methyltransferase domain
LNAWDGRVNAFAYDEVEAMSNYATQGHLDAYRRERLDKYEPYVALFRRLGAPDDGLSVVDVGSGSSAFLYALERAGLLRHGIAIERSDTRHEFAEQWRADEAFRCVVNIRANFADVELEPSTFDRVSVIDETYLYLRPQDEAYPGLLFSTARDALVPGGMLIMDFRNDAPLVAQMAQTGREFAVDLPETNAFSSAAYRQLPSADRRLLRNESVYVARDGTTREKVEITEVPEVPALVSTLSESGFAIVTVYGDLAGSPFEATSSPRAVIIAQT